MIKYSIKLLSLAVLSGFLFSCNNESNEETAAKERAELLKDPEGVKPATPDLLATVPFKKLPVTDSTSFDNFNREDKLSDKLVSKLQLKSLDPNFKSFHSRYRIALSNDVDMMVVTATAEHEMKTFLISYSKRDYKLIDKIQIAYDEIAESAFSAIGKISKEEVVVKNYNYMGDEPVIEVKKYKIEQSGKFVLIKG
ncbi:MAG: hypothetical protein ACO1N0_16165 [Fluviicola sp.]